MPRSSGTDRGRAGLRNALLKTAGCLPGRRRPVPAVLALGALAVSLLAGCSINYAGATTETQSTEGIPDTVAVNVRHRVHKDGRLSLELSASRAVTYNAKKETILTDARFTAYDEEGKQPTEGEARTVVFHSDTENAEISGGVRVHSASEKGEVTAASLDWENKARRLTAPAAEVVTIRKDDGSVVRGTGFTGDFTLRQLTFRGPVQGRYVWQPK